MLREVLDALQIDRVDLVGNDSGGGSAQIFAALNPNRVRSLTLSNCDTHDNWPPEAFKPFVDMAVAGGLKDTLNAMLAAKTIYRSPGAYNGHFESTCYHPLLLFKRGGDCLAAKLRPGNVHSADSWEELLLPEIERQQARGKEVVFRGDAAFAKPELYEALEKRDVKYAIRLPANDNLQRNIRELMTRPVGRPSQKPVFRLKSFLYQAASWTIARRVVAKVEFHCGELFPRVGFIVTNLGTSSRAVVRFYNKRGTAEQWIKEGKQAVAMTRLSCHRFRANEVRLWLSVIAYNLGNLWRRLALPAPIGRWSLTSLQQRLVKTGGRLIKHARYYWLLLAESHLTRRLFADMLRKVAALPMPAG